jgi:glutamate-5-semialdehyde dehydrogenase
MDCTQIFIKARNASRYLTGLEDSEINKLLIHLAKETESNASFIIAENEKDLSLMMKSDPRYDRLQLTPAIIKGIAADIRSISSMPSPLGKILSEYRRPDDLLITKVSVPFGVIGIIYEARPNVTFDVFSLCLKSGNVCILKGGSDAAYSNNAIVSIIKKVLKQFRINDDIISLLPPGREETEQLLKARKYIDLVIPRGSRELIEYVRKTAEVPVIETGAGICHTYFDEYGDRDKGREIVNNAKTRRVSVCNALDCLIIHKNRLNDLAWITGLCADSEVIIYADEKAYKALDGNYPGKLLEKATHDSYGTEFLSFRMAVKTVSSFEKALEHIDEFGSRHSEAIITENPDRQNDFCRITDAAVVYTNASTAFTDGAQFGLGTEIGISTQKLHARGPMALEALTAAKWIVRGNGHIRV